MALGNTIGKAYIQIVPTIGSGGEFKSSLRSIINSDADSVAWESGTKFGSNFGAYVGAGLKVAGAMVIRGVTEITTAAAKISKAVVQNYAEYEQLVGGVETIFGAGGKSLEEYASSVGMTVEQASGKYNSLITAQDAMIKNANDAWMTSGVSANQYMQQVTSFSASLLQSLGGDTNKAVEYANRAMIDMSDNANKYGTDIGMIQNAYQGFAKGNYQMLDNLKLGYGGTKTEMERLISDASKLTDVQAELGITVEEGNMSFGNMVNAISVMQKQMGIAGTTQREATETIQGSLGALTASWQNLITGLGSSEADIKQLIGNVVTAFQNLVKNVTPVITAIAEALPTVFQAIAEMLPSLIDSLLPPLLQAFVSLVQAIISNLPTILPTIMNAIMMLINMIVQNIGTFVSMVIQLIIAIIVAVAENIDTIIPELVKGIVLAIVAIAKHLPQLVAAVGQLVWGIFKGLLNVIIEGAEWIFENVLKPIGEFFANLWDTISEWFVNLATSVWDWLVDIATTVFDWFMGVIKDVAQFFVDLWTSISTWFSDLIKSIGDWFKNIGMTISGWISEKLHAVGQFFTDIWTSISDFFRNLPSKIGEKLRSAWNTVTSWAKEKIRAVGQWAGNIVTGIWNGIRDKIGWIKNKIAGWVDDVLGWFKNLFGIHSPSTIFAGYGRFMDEGLIVGLESSLPAVLDTVDDMGDSINSEMGKVIDDVSNTTLGLNSALPASMAVATSVNENMSGTAQLASQLEIQNAEATRLEAILNLLGEFFPSLLDTLNNVRVVLDSGATVGGLIGEIDRQLGVLNDLKERGAYV